MAAKYGTSAGVAVGQGFIGFGLVAVGVVGTLATVLGFFGSTWWLFDFVANFRTHLAVVLLLVALAYSLVFSKATGLFFMAMALLNASLVLPLYLGNPAPAADGENLTIISFNVDQRASIRDLTFRWIDTVDADIVVLLDATDEWVRATEFADPYKFQNAMPVDRTFGITILSREDVETVVLRISQVRDVAVRVETEIDNEPLVIYAIQSRPASNENDADLRNDYFAEITRLADQETVATVVVGDFQSTSWSHAFKSLVAEADLVNSLDGFQIQTTWPADRWAFFRLPYDHLVHSRDLTTVERYLGPAFGVEHRPIVVTLSRAA